VLGLQHVLRLQQLGAVAHGGRPALPAAVKHELAKALVLVGAVQEDKAALEGYCAR
jgi:hypothetical protein